MINNTNEYPLGPILRIQALDASSATRDSALVGTSVDSWFSSSWMGYYNPSGEHWFYHYTLGWLYFGNIFGIGAWYYDSTLGWLWTNSTDYPYFYQSSSSSWLYYLKGSNSPRYFYNQSAGIWGEY